MSSSCIVTQVHIPNHDVQGNLSCDEKRDLVELSLRHLRLNNPDSCIILSGHGIEPTDNAKKMCDVVFWEPLHQLDSNGYVACMPAQYKFVSRGIKEAKKRGYSKIVKTRGDCVIGIPNIADYCEMILNEEGKRILITQQTGDDFRLGDCFMYGDTQILDRTWSADNHVRSLDGLINTGINFWDGLDTKYGDWRTTIKTVAAFRDVDILKFACLRWNYHKLAKDWGQTIYSMLNGTFDFEANHWGLANGWHAFDEDRNMIVNCNPAFWSQKEFYND